MSQLIAMVTEECKQREQYVNYLRKVDQELCHHDTQMDSTLKLFNRCVTCVAMTTISMCCVACVFVVLLH